MYTRKYIKYYKNRARLLVCEKCGCFRATTAHPLQEKTTIKNVGTFEKRFPRVVYRVFKKRSIRLSASIMCSVE